MARTLHDADNGGHARRSILGHCVGSESGSSGAQAEQALRPRGTEGSDRTCAAGVPAAGPRADRRAFHPLDQQSREHLLRAQRAITKALDGAAAAIEPDDVVPEVTLLRHEWEIVVDLRDITDLRAEHGLNAAARVGPMTNAVLKSQEAALAQAQGAITAIVKELERYADRVSAAANARRDWEDAVRVSDMNDRYLDLVARTAADEHAVAEIC